MASNISAAGSKRPWEENRNVPNEFSPSIQSLGDQPLPKKVKSRNENQGELKRSRSFRGYIGFIATQTDKLQFHEANAPTAARPQMLNNQMPSTSGQQQPIQQGMVRQQQTAMREMPPAQQNPAQRRAEIQRQAMVQAEKAKYPQKYHNQIAVLCSSNKLDNVENFQLMNNITGCLTQVDDPSIVKIIENYRRNYTLPDEQKIYIPPIKLSADHKAVTEEKLNKICGRAKDIAKLRNSRSNFKKILDNPDHKDIKSDTAKYILDLDSEILKAEQILDSLSAELASNNVTEK